MKIYCVDQSDFFFSNYSPNGSTSGWASHLTQKEFNKINTKGEKSDTERDFLVKWHLCQNHFVQVMQNAKIVYQKKGSEAGEVLLDYRLI